MSSVSVPFSPNAYYFDVPCTLSGQTYILTLRYNHRSGGWFLDIADASGLAIVSGIALLTERSLLDPYYQSTRVPKAVLTVLDNSGANADPTKDSFFSTHSLLFLVPDA